MTQNMKESNNVGKQIAGMHENMKGRKQASKYRARFPLRKKEIM